MDAPEPANAAQSDPPVPLSALQRGQRGRLCPDRLSASDSRFLRAMGLRPHALVRLCRRGEPCIVDVVGRAGCGCRIGLSRPLADRVFVTPLA